MMSVCVLTTQLCQTLCNPMDCNTPGSSDNGILQARILEWVAMSSSRGSFWPRDQTHVSYVSCIGRQGTLFKKHLRDFPGSPMVKIWHFHYKGHGFYPWLGKFCLPWDAPKKSMETSRMLVDVYQPALGKGGGPDVQHLPTLWCK